MMFASDDHVSPANQSQQGAARALLLKKAKKEFKLDWIRNSRDALKVEVRRTLSQVEKKGDGGLHHLGISMDEKEDVYVIDPALLRRSSYNHQSNARSYSP